MKKLDTSLTLYKMEEESLTRDIDEISDNIRKKYRVLKHGLIESDQLFRKSYKPIIDPLETIVHQIKEKNSIKDENKEEVLQSKRIKSSSPLLTPSSLKKSKKKLGIRKLDNNDDDEQRKEGNEKPHFLESHVTTEGDDDMEEDEIAPTAERKRISDYIENMFHGPLARKYIRMSLSDERERAMDHTYGVRHENGKWMIGDSQLEIESNDYINIKGNQYKGTIGLYELLFMKFPEDVYNKDDLEAYKSILITTNAHRQNYLANAKINANKGKKYKTIISSLFSKHMSKQTGHGHVNMRHMTNVGIDYVHWNNPNELVERLRLLTASQRSGHTGHTNEIVSIVEELREAGIIV